MVKREALARVEIFVKNIGLDNARKRRAACRNMSIIIIVQAVLIGTERHRKTLRVRVY
jgi:hypothetical protein